MESAKITPNLVEGSATVESVLGGGKSLEEVMDSMFMEIQSEDAEELVIDIVGIEAPIANALRRIMIAEVPTMAIEDIDLYQNTSVIPDEVLAHRLGLIPIKADPEYFEFSSGQVSATNTLQFRLHKTCTRSPDGTVVGQEVYSSDLEWVPIGDQLTKLGSVRPVHEDILIAKLGPGQEIEADLFCVKGTGKTHTKWSPVCTASYRLLPEVSLNKKLTGQDAKSLKKACPMRVFDIESSHLVVKNPRNCTTCRECIRHDDSLVNLGKKKDHFICKFYVVTIESTGILTPRQILVQSIHKLKEKTAKWLEQIQIYKNTPKA